jgi:hypothetical protein
MSNWNQHASSTLVDLLCAGRALMRIEAGYDIAFNCFQEVPLVLMLSVHPSRPRPFDRTSDCFLSHDNVSRLSRCFRERLHQTGRASRHLGNSKPLYHQGRWQAGRGCARCSAMGHRPAAGRCSRVPARKSLLRYGKAQGHRMVAMHARISCQPYCRFLADRDWPQRSGRDSDATTQLGSIDAGPECPRPAAPDLDLVGKSQPSYK